MAFKAGRGTPRVTRVEEKARQGTIADVTFSISRPVIWNRLSILLWKCHCLIKLISGIIVVSWTLEDRYIK